MSALETWGLARLAFTPYRQAEPLLPATMPTAVFVSSMHVLAQPPCIGQGIICTHRRVRCYIRWQILRRKKKKKTVPPEQVEWIPYLGSIPSAYCHSASWYHTQWVALPHTSHCQVFILIKTVTMFRLVKDVSEFCKNSNAWLVLDHTFWKFPLHCLTHNPQHVNPTLIALEKSLLLILWLALGWKMSIYKWVGESVLKPQGAPVLSWKGNQNFSSWTGYVLYSSWPFWKGHEALPSWGYRSNCPKSTSC